jgi:predicted ATP-dependent protease
VLPVGGIREKVLAAHRTGLKTVILPRRNEPDTEDVPQELRDEITFLFVDSAEEVLRLALRDGSGERAAASSSRTPDELERPRRGASMRRDHGEGIAATERKE